MKLLLWFVGVILVGSGQCQIRRKVAAYAQLTPEKTLQINEAQVEKARLAVEHREALLAEREQALDARDADLDRRNWELDGRILETDDQLRKREAKLSAREAELAAREQEVWRRANEREQYSLRLSIDRESALLAKEREVDAKSRSLYSSNQ